MVYIPKAGRFLNVPGAPGPETDFRGASWPPECWKLKDALGLGLINPELYL